MTLCHESQRLLKPFSDSHHDFLLQFDSTKFNFHMKELLAVKNLINLFYQPELSHKCLVRYSAAIEQFCHISLEHPAICVRTFLQ